MTAWCRKSLVEKRPCWFRGGIRCTSIWTVPFNSITFHCFPPPAPSPLSSTSSEKPRLVHRLAARPYNREAGLCLPGGGEEELAHRLRQTTSNSWRSARRLGHPHRANHSCVTTVKHLLWSQAGTYSGFRDQNHSPRNIGKKRRHEKAWVE